MAEDARVKQVVDRVRPNLPKKPLKAQQVFSTLVLPTWKAMNLGPMTPVLAKQIFTALESEPAPGPAPPPPRQQQPPQAPRPPQRPPGRR